MREEEYRIRLDNKRTEQFDQIISLLQKLVDRKERTKTISTEVPMSAKETALLDSIEA